MAQNSTEAGSSAQSDSHSASADESYRNSSDRGNTTEEEEDANGQHRMTLKWINTELKRDWKTYYRTAELNEKLYFHHKGFAKIEHLDIFPDLKCLYFEQNGCVEISGLDKNPKLMCLYLHENIISKIEGLNVQSELKVLNLSDNMLNTIENLGALTGLDSLYLARNRIGRNGISDIQGLLDVPHIVSLDLQNNHIDDPAVLPEIFQKLTNLKVLYLQNNPVTKKIQNYRKTVIAAMPNLTYLDDRPVFKDDRRNAEAFSRGGLEEERKERENIKKEERERHDRNHNAFKEMMAKAREEKRLADEAARKERGEPEPAEVQKHEEEKLDDKLDEIQKKEKAEKETTIVINTWDDNEKIAKGEMKGVPVKEDGEESNSDDEEAPELEQVTTEELQQEREVMSEEQKNQQKIYEGIRDAQKVTDDDLPDLLELCGQQPVSNVEEEEEKPKDEEKAEEKEEEQLEEIKEGVNQGSNLEELD